MTYLTLPTHVLILYSLFLKYVTSAICRGTACKLKQRLFDIHVLHIIDKYHTSSVLLCTFCRSQSPRCEPYLIKWSSVHRYSYHTFFCQAHTLMFWSLWDKEASTMCHWAVPLIFINIHIRSHKYLTLDLTLVPT